MQRIFRRYTGIILTVAILVILIIDFLIMAYLLKDQQYQTFDVKLEQVIHTMESNQIELTSIKINLNEDYLTRARAAAYMEKNNPELSGDVNELQNLAELLDVDEIHIIDGNGIIIYSSVPKYLGLDFTQDEQTKEFLSILESDDPNAYVVQEAQPNAAEGRMMQYVGVARLADKGIVQVGLKPLRQMQAQERFTYSYIFSRFPTDIGENFFAVDCVEDEVIAYSGVGSYAYVNYKEYYNVEHLAGCEEGAFKVLEDGEVHYVLTKQYEDVLIGVSIPRSILYEDLWESAITTLLYLGVILAVVVALLYYLLDKKVIRGIHDILSELSQITTGDLETRVDVGGNHEFEQLSEGINTMVESIVNTSNRTSRIIAMSRIPLAAFEYQSDMKNVFVTSKLAELLGLSDEELKELSDDAAAFHRKIQEIIANPISGEKDIYQIAEDDYVRIHLSESESGYLGVVTDVTAEIEDKQRILYESNHDQLTGLCRYQYFKQQAARLLEDKQQKEICATVMMDLDDFKNVNDSYGHDVGDRYLIAFADILKGMPKEHCIPARRSGDEFCIFIYGYDTKTEIEEFLQSLWKKLQDSPVEMTNDKMQIIGVSGGYVMTKDNEANINDLLQCADKALYQAKGKQKGHFEMY